MNKLSQGKTKTKDNKATLFCSLKSHILKAKEMYFNNRIMMTTPKILLKIIFGTERNKT